MQTSEIFEKLINKEYINVYYIKPKIKQLNILLKDYFCSDEIFISFLGVTNTGSFPIVFSNNCSVSEIITEFYSLNDSDHIEDETELFLVYARNFEDLFN